ncbi:MAG: hypothetical protein AAGD43_02970 [Pseudomonadota bacterium]
MAIARLLDDNGTRVVGYLYLWESDDLGILWTDGDRVISFIDRVLEADTLARARLVGSAELVEHLEALPVTES